ncbi:MULTISPECIES: hypothetical protein [Amycolatopsis]|uniref:Preprotein translocase subunit SecG n=1 Tax=Amycolatopsis thermalba TaxID=944492 RepID=A0ABY4P4I3_9PSEU|nr:MULTISPECIES: hypothetical protein [Amycolatopsis]OXM73149.1 hypothetical protein CF166_11595 [Amycolatopsis sp. KNN50.9b]UQS27168.1 hypothetical protein L1857_32380 [Amycolatopsis thermalba]
MSLLLPVTAPVATTALVLAQQPGNGDNGGQGEDFGKSSPLGFLILLLFLIAVALLVRSMTKHLKRVPASFDPEEKAESADAPEPEEKATKTADEPVKQPQQSESS